jgi:hypothetical protein
MQISDFSTTGIVRFRGNADLCAKFELFDGWGGLMVWRDPKLQTLSIAHRITILK